jgi:hypothetical protein
MNQPVHVPIAICLVEPAATGEKSVLQITDKLATSFETREIRLPKQHHLYQNDNFFSMRLQGHEALSHQRSEIFKLAAFKAPHNVYHLLR